MRRHLANALIGAVDYAAYPAAMLVAAPVLLRYLGPGGYGVWAVMTAVVSGGAILASGFGDANIHYLSRNRDAVARHALVEVVQALLGINLALGGLIALVVLLCAPFVARHVAGADSGLQRDCLTSLGLAAVLVVLRAVESVCISTQRAFQRYGAAVRLSIAARVLSVVAGAWLTAFSSRVTTVLLCVMVLSFGSTCLQLRDLRILLRAHSLRPSWDRAAVRKLAGFGIPSWLLATSTVVFGQADRVVLGFWLGAPTLAAYALCAQLTQPLNGLVSSALHFLFPYLAHQPHGNRLQQQRRVAFSAAGVNVVAVLALTTALQAGETKLLAWLARDSSLGVAAKHLFSPVLWSTALLGLAATPTYVLYALGHVRTVVLYCLAGAALYLVCTFVFVPRWQMQGAIAARFAYGVTAVLLYAPMMRALQGQQRNPEPGALCEEL